MKKSLKFTAALLYCSVLIILIFTGISVTFIWVIEIGLPNLVNWIILDPVRTIVTFIILGSIVVIPFAWGYAKDMM